MRKEKLTQEKCMLCEKTVRDGSHTCSPECDMILKVIDRPYEERLDPHEVWYVWTTWFRSPNMTITYMGLMWEMSVVIYALIRSSIL